MLLTASVHLISWFQAIVLGLLQGVTELFPISSLGHTVILPHLFGWNNIVAWQHEGNSPWVPFLVSLHVGSAIGLLIYFWRTWLELLGALWSSISNRRIETANERLVWLIIAATIPVGILGLALQKVLEDAVAKPIYASIFLVINGVILFAAESFRQRGSVRRLAAQGGRRSGRRLDTLDYKEAAIIGLFESTALIAGISRDGVAMTGGLVRGLSNADAARFAFLLAMPPILLAGLVKMPQLVGHQGNGIHGPALVAIIFAALAAVGATHFLTKFFSKRGNLRPFGLYCVVFGLAMVIYNA
ncbi:MAG: undecaprenyl-diphosphate phosphatase [Solirubrobacterales bacterium]|nr:undecaprenyl-diphosphate phosphatase [Solirubrobacterales bacterium]